jgi:hypothetical protein
MRRASQWESRVPSSAGRRPLLIRLVSSLWNGQKGNRGCANVSAFAVVGAPAIVFGVTAVQAGGFSIRVTSVDHLKVAANGDEEDDI